jgi:hypothetical protein
VSTTALDRDLVVAHANRMILHLSESATHVDQVKREAIIALTSVILDAAGCYKGFRYIGQNEQLLRPVQERVWDNTRVQFY